MRASAPLLGSLRSPRRAAEAETGHFTCSENRTFHLLPTGGLTQRLRPAQYEEIPYDEDGNNLAGSFMDYLVPTAGETLAWETGHAVTHMNILIAPDRVWGVLAGKGCWVTIEGRARCEGGDGDWAAQVMGLGEGYECGEGDRAAVVGGGVAAGGRAAGPTRMSSRRRPPDGVGPCL